jgi:2-hydroxy-6-oxonona-2,4-dienedioate hydrolase/4,5:9,10-diseco-3-hydroxy-5,9,17-trioxoandrosta-1(10),2-diene-4-oate hydrolase
VVAASEETKPRAKTVETSECLISFREVGEGPVLLCLHGSGPGASGWGNFGGNAEDLKGEFRVIVPDHPGFGGSKIVKDSGVPLQQLAAKAMAEFLEALNVRSAHLVGNSAGGGIAMHMALGYPGVVDRLVLMGPWTRGFGIRMFSAPTSSLLREYYPGPSPEKMRKLIEAMFSRADVPDLEALVRSRYEASVAPGVAEGYVRMQRGVDPHPDPRSLFDRFQDLENEALLLWGRDDRFSTLDDAFMYLAALKRSRLIVFRDCGHWVQVERRLEFAAYVTTFLKTG